MKKCDWCRNDSKCYGIMRNECIVKDYKDYTPYHTNREKACRFCKHKEVCKFETSTGEYCEYYIED